MKRMLLFIVLFFLSGSLINAQSRIIEEEPVVITPVPKKEGVAELLRNLQELLEREKRITKKAQKELRAVEEATHSESQVPASEMTISQFLGYPVARPLHELAQEAIAAAPQISYSDLTINNYERWFEDLKKEMGIDFDVTIYYRSGYFFINSDLLTGERSDTTLKEVFNARLEHERHSPDDQSYDYEADERILKKNIAKLVGNYKIHLMPGNEHDFMEILKTLILEFKNPEFAQHLNSFKFKSGIDFNSNIPVAQQLEQQGEILPLFVIYPASVKESAQKVLDIVSTLFWGMDGLNVTPRYNIKVNSLIYYSQGDSDFKNPNWQDDYNEDMTLYRTDFEGKGIRKDYRLENPV